MGELKRHHQLKNMFGLNIGKFERFLAQHRRSVLFFLFTLILCFSNMAFAQPYPYPVNPGCCPEPDTSVYAPPHGLFWYFTFATGELFKMNRTFASVVPEIAFIAFF